MEEMKSHRALSGLYVPLLTPLLRGEIDVVSLRRLIRSVEPYIAGYVPCLSTGEGEFLSSQQWAVVIEATRRASRKPIVAGIKHESFSEVCRRAGLAADIGCSAIAVPVPSPNEGESLAYFAALGAKVALPIMVYNTEERRFKTMKALQSLQKIAAVVALKDSSGDERFFAAACRWRALGRLRFSLLQGMEHLMQVPAGCDGHLVALANVEPKLCAEMLATNSARTFARIRDCFWRYNLGGEWYVSLKAILLERGVLRSAEQLRLAVRP
jgi:4-hydroxy-tetrahydrodipicolinate synthase